MFAGVPYGARARLILIFLQGEAVSKGREVVLGDSLSAWMKRHCQLNRRTPTPAQFSLALASVVEQKLRSCGRSHAGYC